jgi:hypothetical protein
VSIAAPMDAISRALDTAAPAIMAASKLAAASEPLAHATVDFAKTFWARLAPYHPHEFGPAVVGAYRERRRRALFASRVLIWMNSRCTDGVCGVR